MPVTRHTFCCPRCGGSTLEEVSSAITYSIISNFEAIQTLGTPILGGGINWYPNWDGSETEELDVLRYQCFDCQFVVMEGYVDTLYSTLVQKGLIKELQSQSEEPTIVSDWEV